MATPQFIFPYSFENLVQKQTFDNRYCVDIQNQRLIKGIDEKRLKRVLTDLDCSFVDNYNLLQQNDKFDLIYFVIDTFGSGTSEYPNIQKVSIKIMEQTGDLLITYINKLLKKINNDQANPLTLPSVMAINRQTFKMILFLIAFYLRNTFIKKIDSDHNANKRGRKVEESYEGILEAHKASLDSIQRALKMDLKVLFEKKDIEEQFYKTFLQTSLRMMESNCLVKNEKTRSMMFGIVQSVTSVFSEQQQSKQELKQIQLQLIHLLYDQEQLVQPIADYIVNIYQNNQLIYAREFTFSFLQLFVTYLSEKTNPNSEINVFKNARDFFSILSSSLPKMFINNLSCFLTLFDSESYMMRNTVCEIISNILKNVLTASNEEQEEYIGDEETKVKQKHSLIDKIIDRVFDKSAYCRAQVLTILSDLCENNVIPPQFLPHILKAAIGRTRDVGAIVRRKALQLITRVVNYYVYIYQANKESKFISKEQVNKEIKKLQLSMFNSNEQLDSINDSMKELANIDQLDENNEEEMVKLVEKEKNLKLTVQKNQSMIERYQEYSDFLQSIDILIPILIQLLGSKSVYDIIETIRLLMYLKKFNITSSESGIKKMIVLVWSKDKLVKDELMHAYWTLYLNNSDQKHKQIAKNLISLMIDTNISEACSIEQLLLSIMDTQTQYNKNESKSSNSSNELPIEPAVFTEIWEIFSRTFRKLCEVVNLNEKNEAQALETEKEMIMWKKEMRSAIQILRIVCTRLKTNWNLKLESFKNILVYYKKSIGKVDWVVVKELASISELVKKKDNIDLVKQIVQLLSILLIRSHGTEDSEWFIASDQILKVAFLTFSNPEAIVKYLIKQMSQFIQDKRKYDSQFDNNKQTFNHKIDVDIQSISGRAFEHKLSHVLYIAGNSALKFLMHCERIDEYLNKRRIEAEEKKRLSMAQNSSNKQDDNNNNDDKDKDDKDMDKINGGFEAEYEEHQRTLHSIQDRLVVDSPIFSYFCHLAQKICWNMYNSLSADIQESDRMQYSFLLRRNVILDRVSILCLIKFMCVSSQICKKNLDLIFNMLESPADPIVKTNILIGIGDLYHRYPNILERYLHLVYQSLSDEDSRVRKTCLMVITHLVLNDMLKVKADISSIAVLIDDNDSRIQNMVKLFFHELNKKDSKAIYNLLPELIGRLSIDSVNESIFHNFCENVLPHIDKDKQGEMLIEKLCQRFSLTHTEKEWINISHAMKMFSYNEKGLKKVLEYFEQYRDKLNTPQILDNFKFIIQKVKKMPKQSPEQKQLIEEFESKVNNFKKETFDDKRYKKERPKQRQSAKPQDKKTNNEQNKKTSQRRRGDQKKGIKDKYNNISEEEDSFIDDNDDEEDDFALKKKQPTNSQQYQQNEKQKEYKISTRRNRQKTKADSGSEKDNRSMEEEF